MNRISPPMIKELHPNEIFVFGSNIGGYTPAQITPLFTEAIEVENIRLPQSFWEYIE